MPRWTDSGSAARCASSASGVIGASQTSATALGCRGVSSAGSSGAPSRTFRSGGSSRWLMHWTAASISTSGGAAKHSTGSSTSDMRRSRTSSSRLFRSARWEVAVEVTFSIYGERGSIDVFAFHPIQHVVAVNEVKASVGEAGNTVLGIDRKSRLAPQIARDRGWPCRGVARFPGRRRQLDVARPDRAPLGHVPDRVSGRRPRLPRMDPRPGRRSAERDPVPRAPEWASGEQRNATGSARSGVGWTLNTRCGPRPGSPECTRPRPCRTRRRRE